jgi:hypothetical protein
MSVSDKGAAAQLGHVWQELRKPFPKEVMGLLPKVSCYACAKASKEARSPLDKHCAKHSMIKCKDCQAYISEAHIHLDFVGHAPVTDRLNSVLGPDNWDWDPLAVDDRGLPALDAKGNLWIKLLVRKSSDSPWAKRLGYGDGSDSMKELIGDALRNAAMRFGIALDLWTKDELESTLAEPDLKNEKPTGNLMARDQKAEIVHLLDTYFDVALDDMVDYVRSKYSLDLKKMTANEADDLLGMLRRDGARMMEPTA